MKLKLLLFVCLALLASCSSSPEDRARATIEADLKQKLYYPDSYEHIETTLLQDSVYSDTPASPSTYKLVIDLKQAIELYEEYEHEMKLAESKMAAYSRLYDDLFKVEHKQAKEEYEKYQNALSKVQEKMVSIGEKMQEVKNSPKLVGSMYIHRYRAKNKEGDAFPSAIICTLNEDKTEVVSSYSEREMEEMAEIVTRFQEWQMQYGETPLLE